MNEVVRLRLIEPAARDAANLEALCTDALELMLTSRGNPTLEVESTLKIDPHCVRAHCLRLALIVRADGGAGRLAAAESATAIEAAGIDPNDPARRHCCR
jgi:hypothetical protein